MLWVAVGKPWGPMRLYSGQKGAMNDARVNGSGLTFSDRAARKRSAGPHEQCPRPAQMLGSFAAATGSIHACGGKRLSFFLARQLLSLG